MKFTQWLMMKRWQSRLAATTAEEAGTCNRKSGIAIKSSMRRRSLTNHLFPSRRR